ncbi:MAG TPA: hypothetical protein VFC02_09810 [Anaerolineales bacterium]|nr:hypothetical protein [Anaerolineales bacterium]
MPNQQPPNPAVQPTENAATPIVCIIEWGGEMAKVEELDFGGRTDVTLREIIIKLREQIGLQDFDEVEWGVVSMITRQCFNNLDTVYNLTTHGGLWIKIFGVPIAWAHALIDKCIQLANERNEGLNNESSNLKKATHDATDTEVLDH